jgi:hypothetical protein
MTLAVKVEELKADHPQIFEASWSAVLQQYGQDAYGYRDAFQGACIALGIVVVMHNSQDSTRFVSVITSQVHERPILSIETWEGPYFGLVWLKNQ